MEEYKTARYIVRIGIPAVVLIFIAGFGASMYSSKLELQKEALRQQEYTQRAIATQQQKTERTEERSQFWQKIVPWGQDEQETSE